MWKNKTKLKRSTDRKFAQRKCRAGPIKHNLVNNGGQKKKTRSKKRRNTKRTTTRKKFQGGNLSTHDQTMNDELLPLPKEGQQEVASICAPAFTSESYAEDVSIPIRTTNSTVSGTCMEPSLLKKVAENVTENIKTSNQVASCQIFRKKNNISNSSIDKNPTMTEAILAKQCLKEILPGKEASDWVKETSFSEYEKRKIIEKHFLPISPVSWKKNPHEWLDSISLQKSMKQLEDLSDVLEFHAGKIPNTEKKHRFLSIGPTSIDFSSPLITPLATSSSSWHCVEDKLCTVDVKKWISEWNTDSIGIILNLDKHNEPGSHWVSIFIRLVRPSVGVYYYDSGGNATLKTVPKEIHNFCRKVSEQLASIYAVSDIPRELSYEFSNNNYDNMYTTVMNDSHMSNYSKDQWLRSFSDYGIPQNSKKKNSTCVYRYNTVSHQRGNTECGVFSIRFLLHMMIHQTGTAYDWYLFRARPNDQDTFEYRNKFWRERK